MSDDVPHWAMLEAQRTYAQTEDGASLTKRIARAIIKAKESGIGEGRTKGYEMGYEEGYDYGYEMRKEMTSGY